MPINPFDYRSPWTPAPIRSNARTYAQWLASTLGASASWIANQIRTRLGIAGQLAGRLAAAAQSFASTLNELNESRLGTKIPRSQIPRNPHLPEAYRAVATIRLVDPDAPPNARASHWFDYVTVVLDFDHNPTLGEIQDAARNMLGELVRAGSPKAQEKANWPVKDITVVVIERRT